MAKSRRKSGSCTRGRYKMKKMGKGWSSERKPRGHAKPIVREATAARGSTAGDS